MSRAEQYLYQLENNAHAMEEKLRIARNALGLIANDNKECYSAMIESQRDLFQNIAKKALEDTK